MGRRNNQDDKMPKMYWRSMISRLTEDLLRSGADPNELLAVEGVSPMHIASGLGTEATKLLLEYNGNPNVRSVEGTTPLHVAALWGHTEALKLLLQHGGDPTVCDQEGFSIENHEEYRRIADDKDSTIYISDTLKRAGKNRCLHLTSPDKDSTIYINDTLKRAVKNRCLDVTSPDHPYITVKGEEDGCRHKTLPLVEIDPDTSSDSFVTCTEDCQNTDINNSCVIEIYQNTGVKRRSVDEFMPGSLPTNLSDLITSDESFSTFAPSKQPTSKSLTSINISSPTKTDYVLNWAKANFPANFYDPLLTDDSSGTLIDEQNCGLNKAINSIDRLSLCCSSEISSASTIEYNWHRDPESGHVLLEKHIASSLCTSSGRPSLSSICSVSTADSEKTELYDWQEDLTNQEIRRKLQNLGDKPGPVTSSTRQTYLARLKDLHYNPAKARLGISQSIPDYPPDLRQALDGQFDICGLRDLEDELISVFEDPTKSADWREGCIKSSFNYLLLDPRVTMDLPNRADNIGYLESFQVFINAIFYIGKGKRNRPYCHLFEALSQTNDPKNKVSDKVQHILDIWKAGCGVVSLHCFQSVIPVEAYTREACMVDAVGLPHLTNVKKGDVYGVAKSWSLKTKRRFGVYLLKKALQILLAEGERQLSPGDIKKSH